MIFELTNTSIEFAISSLSKFDNDWIIIFSCKRSTVCVWGMSRSASKMVIGTSLLYNSGIIGICADVRIRCKITVMA